MRNFLSGGSNLRFARFLSVLCETVESSSSKMVQHHGYHHRWQKTCWIFATRSGIFYEIFHQKAIPNFRKEILRFQTVLVIFVSWPFISRSNGLWSLSAPELLILESYSLYKFAVEWFCWLVREITRVNSQLKSICMLRYASLNPYRRFKPFWVNIWVKLPSHFYRNDEWKIWYVGTPYIIISLESSFVAQKESPLGIWSI